MTLLKHIKTELQPFLDREANYFKAHCYEENGEIIEKDTQGFLSAFRNTQRQNQYEPDAYHYGQYMAYKNMLELLIFVDKTRKYNKKVK